MPRVAKNAKARARMCERLVHLFDVVYRRTDAEMARLMGYANTSTLYRIRQGIAFPDVERLEHLVSHPPARGVAINLNWIVAGHGQPLLRVAKNAVTREMSIGEFIDERVPQH